MGVGCFAEMSMSMVWARIPGQTWAGSSASFIGMWIAMMAAMMLPSLAPVLWRYYQIAGRATRVSPVLLTALMGGGYFSVWTAFGIVVFPVGAALAATEMHLPALARIVPFAIGVVVVIAGALQFTEWKKDRLVCCREMSQCGEASSFNFAAAWRLGVHAGLDCSYCCAGLTMALLVVGVMDLRMMSGVTAAITIERLAPNGQRAAQIVGVVVSAFGMCLVARAAGLA